MNRAELKRQAREQLGGGILKNMWLHAVVAMLIVTAIMSAASTMLFLTIFLVGPLGVGVMAFFKNIARSGNISFASLFDNCPFFLH